MKLTQLFVWVAFLTSALAQYSDNSIEEEEEEEEDNMITVETPSGDVIGMEVEGSKAFAFKGIPYAEPPVGPLRLKDPVPKQPWKKARNATEFGAMCLQRSAIYPSSESDITDLKGDEDCLFLNVFTTRLPNNNREAPPASSLLPVMVYIPGGGYQFGNGNINPQTLTDKDVVFVSINYRLSALGFLPLGNEVLSGNMGMKDQVEALRWVQINIASFGGDPARVTIMGESAGGFSVHMQQMSPLSRGLFNGVIAMSGTALQGNYGLYNGSNRKVTQAYLETIRCNQTSTYEIMECIKEKPLEELLPPTNLQRSFGAGIEEDAEPRHFFYPEIDDFATEPFLPDLPINLLRQGKYHKVPLMVGTTEDDGLFKALINFEHLDALNANWTKFAAKALYGVDEEDLSKEQATLTAVFRQFYTAGKNFTQDDLAPLTNFFTDLIFERPAVKSADLQCQYQDMAPTFLYVFSEKPAVSTSAKYAKGTAAEGASFGVNHVDNFNFLFGAPDEKSINAIQTDEQEKVAETLRTLWTNFVKFGDPTPYRDSGIPVWMPYSCQDKEYMDINAESELKSNIHKERSYFWDKLYFDELELIQKTPPPFFSTRTQSAMSNQPPPVLMSQPQPVVRNPPQLPVRQPYPPGYPHIVPGFQNAVNPFSNRYPTQ